MHGRTTDGAVHVGGDARERFYDSRGYGRPTGDGLRLAPVEAAHLLYRDDLDAVDGMALPAYLAAVDGLVVRFLVYKDLRDRGFYLSPVRDAADAPPGADFAVYPRGKGPWDDEVEHYVRVTGEREDLRADSLGDVVLAVVDEESEITYLESDRPAVDGTNAPSLPTDVPATLLHDRAVVWDAPPVLYERGFFGQPLDRDADTLQLSLLEAAHLAAAGVLAVDGGRDAIVERGRAVEGERFDRRLQAYDTLRERGVVPKTGFKFGADFRTYANVDSVEDLGHSEYLVRVLRPDDVLSPRDLALDVRLAHGVRKRMVFALADGGVRWLSVGRITP